MISYILLMLLPFFNLNGNIECGLHEVNYEFTDCNSEGNYNIFFNFQYQNTSDSFRAYRDNDYVGTFAYEDLPIELGSFEGNGQGHVFFFKDNENLACSVTKQTPGNTCSGSQECDLSELQIIELPCNANNQFFITINFNHQNTSDQFKVQGNGNQYGTFSYDDLPITLGPFNGLVNTDYEFVIKDILEPECSIVGVIHAPYCNTGECNISNITYEFSDCNEEGYYWIFFDFDYQNTSDSFKVYSGNTYYGTFAYANLPLTITGVAGNGQGHGFLFKDQNHTGCAEDIFVPGQNCNGQNECDLNELQIEQLPCNEENQFYVVIDFNHINTGDLFKVQGNGNNYGTFSYSELPITLGPFNGNVNTAYEFGITDLDHPDCHVGGFIDAPYCTEGCHLYEVVYEHSECDEEGNFDISFNFQHQNTSDSFHLYIENILYGTFAYADLPIQVLNVEGNGAELHYLFKDAVNEDCHTLKEITGPDCDGQGDCDLGELNIEQTQCNEENQFFVVIDFYHINTGDLFKVQGNGINYGTFSYAELPITLGPFNGNVNTAYEFGITDLDHPDCHVGGFIEAPYCTEGCHLYEVVYEHSECDEEGNFNISFDFQHQNTSDSFHLYIENILYGTFAYADLPIQVLNVEGNGEELHYLFKDAVNEDCHTLKEITGPDCDGQGDCDLGELNIEQLPCNEDNHFYVVIDFYHINTSDHFKVQGNGNLYGTFNYDDLPITLGPFNGNVNTSYEFGITDLEFTDCHIGGGIEAPYCEEEGCHLYEVSYDYSECNEDGNYSITFNFQHENTSDSFKVYRGNDYMGVFAYSDLPITLGTFQGNGQGHLFIFKDLENPECKVIKEVPGINCENELECDINEVSASISNCDNEGQFFVEIDFNFMNVSDSFSIQGNGISYGHFSYDDLPVILGPFDGDSEQSYEFGVHDLIFEGCHAGTFITPPYCENGFAEPLMNITLSNIVCINANSYTADVDIDNIPGEMLVNLWESNDLIGIYNSSLFPIQVILSTDLAPLVKMNSVDEPENFAAKVYTHPECILATDIYDEQNLNLFPNPTSNDLIINWKDVSYEYQLMDINHTLVMKGRGSDKTVVQTANLQPGVYIMQLSTGSKIIVKKVIKI